VKAELQVNKVHMTVYEDNLKKGKEVLLEDYLCQPARKEIKRPNFFKSVISSTEDRFLTVANGSLYVFKPVPTESKIKSGFKTFFAKVPDSVAEANGEGSEDKRAKGIVKSCTELERLFKVDVFERGNDIDLVLHFVNKARNPRESPEVKRY